MWKLGKHCPFQAGGETGKLPASRKPAIFLVRRAVSAGGDEAGGFAAGLGAFWGWGLRLGAGSIADPTPPVCPRPVPANRRPP